MPEHDEIEIRSDEVQEILTRVPSWMIRWGITMIFVIVLMGLVLSYFIKYPDVITGAVVLTTEEPPAKLVPKIGGEIEQVYFEDNALIEKGQVVAEIKNPLSEEAVTYLIGKVAEVEDGLTNEFKKGIDFDENELVFGSVQNDYNVLVQSISEYHVSLSPEQYNKRRNILERQVANYRKLSKINDVQLGYAEKDFKLAEEKYQANKSLYESNVISKVEFYEQEMAFSRVKTEMENLKKSNVQNTITLTDYERQLNELEIEFLTKKVGLTKSIETALRNIRNEVENWQQTYLLESPIDGRLTYLTALTTNQFVEVGKPLFAVVPEDENEFIGYIELEKRGAGKVEVGQEVKIQFDNFPSNEFGQVMATVDQISSIPNEDKYLVKVRLTNGLMSSYKKQLIYSPEMSGQADIITKDLRVLERVFNELREVFDQ